jgi:hypothetical protein
MTRRTTRVLLTFVLAALAGLGCLSASASAASVKSKESGVRFTSKTITVSRAIVRKNLVGISADGIFKFKHAAGPLAKLKRGKVMLLQGSDALLVTSIGHSHGKLLVHTKPAMITDVISKGHIAFSGVPNFHNAVLSKIVEPVSAKASADFARPSYPYVGRPLGPARALGAAAPSFSAQGSTSTFGYSLTFTPTTATRLDISGTLCFISFSVCGNGPSNGLSAEVNLSGYIDAGNTSGGVTVNGGSVTGSSFSIKSLVEHAHITYTVARGDGSSAGGDPPVFRVPIGLDYTIPGEIPIYLKLQVALLVKLGVSSKNAVIHGGVDVNTTGSDTLTETGKTVTGSETGDSVSGNILTQSNGGVPQSESLAPSGVVVAVQFPKLGVGLGFTSANGLAYVDVVSSVGQTVGAAIAGMFCSSYDVDISVGAGLEAQVGLGKLGLSLATPKKILYDKMAKTHDPGCPQT